MHFWMRVCSSFLFLFFPGNQVAGTGTESAPCSECRQALGSVGRQVSWTQLSKPFLRWHLVCVQVGHAICATLTPGHDPVQKVTLIPRGQARGLTW